MGIKEKFKLEFKKEMARGELDRKSEFNKSKILITKEI